MKVLCLLLLLGLPLTSLGQKASMPVPPDLVIITNLKAWSRLQKQGLMHVGLSVTRIEYADRSVRERGPLRLPLRN